MATPETAAAPGSASTDTRMPEPVDSDARAHMDVREGRVAKVTAGRAARAEKLEHLLQAGDVTRVPH